MFFKHSDYIAAYLLHMRKTSLLLLAFLFFTATLSAQFIKKTSTGPSFSENLALITKSFRNNFYQVQGGQLPSQEDMDVYNSAVLLAGSQHCVIYRFNSKTDTTACWQGIMYAGENYKEAVKAYKSTCRLVDKCKVILGNNEISMFRGKTDDPDANLRFASSVFRLNTKYVQYEDFCAEVELLNTGFEQWEVHISLQNKRDDTEN